MLPKEIGEHSHPHIWGWKGSLRTSDVDVWLTESVILVVAQPPLSPVQKRGSGGRVRTWFGWCTEASGQNNDVPRCSFFVGSVPANIEYQYIRIYRLTASVYSNFRVFQEPYIRIYGFFGHFVKCFRIPYSILRVWSFRKFEFKGSNIEYENFHIWYLSS